MLFFSSIQNYTNIFLSLFKIYGELKKKGIESNARLNQTKTSGMIELDSHIRICFGSNNFYKIL